MSSNHIQIFDTPRLRNLVLLGHSGSGKTTLMAALVDDGRLRWDDPVAHVWPAVRLADAERSEAFRRPRTE